MRRTRELFRKKKPVQEQKKTLNPDKLEELKWRVFEEKAKPNKIPPEVFEAMFKEAMEELYWKYGLDSEAVKKLKPKEIEEIAENSLEHALREKINFRVRRMAVMGGNSFPVKLDKMPEWYAYRKGEFAEEAIREKATELLKRGKKPKFERIPKEVKEKFDKEFRRAVADLSWAEEKKVRDIMKDPAMVEKAKKMALKRIGMR